MGSSHPELPTSNATRFKRIKKIIISGYRFIYTIKGENIMPFLFRVKQAILNFFGINDAGDQLEINDEGDILEL